MHQKQPPANMAVAVFGAGVAACAETMAAMPATAAAANTSTAIIRFINVISTPQCRHGFVGRHEAQGQAVVAIAFAGWRRTIVENVALVTAAATAMIFSAFRE